VCHRLQPYVLEAATPRIPKVAAPIRQRPTLPRWNRASWKRAAPTSTRGASASAPSAARVTSRPEPGRRRVGSSRIPARASAGSSPGGCSTWGARRGAMAQRRRMVRRSEAAGVTWRRRGPKAALRGSSGRDSALDPNRQQHARTHRGPRTVGGRLRCCQDGASDRAAGRRTACRVAG